MADKKKKKESKSSSEKSLLLQILNLLTVDRNDVSAQIREMNRKVEEITAKLKIVEERLDKIESDGGSDEALKDLLSRPVPWAPGVHPFPFVPPIIPTPYNPDDSWTSPKFPLPEVSYCTVCGGNGDLGGLGYTCASTACPWRARAYETKPQVVSTTSDVKTTCACGNNPSCQCGN